MKTKFNQLVYYNSISYGNAIRIKKSTLIMVFIVFCIITPCTNWLIVFSKKLIKNDLVLRWGN